MAEDLRAELKNMAGLVRWELLKPHAARDAIIVVNPQLELTEVGAALAADNTQLVARWVNEQLIAKPTADQLAQWGTKNKLFTSLIVQPYVLIQDSLLGEAAIKEALEQAALDASAKADAVAEPSGQAFDQTSDRENSEDSAGEQQAS